MYDVATEHGQVVFINYHVAHGKRVKEYVAHLRMEYVRALGRGAVFMGTSTTIPGGEARTGRWTVKCGCSWRKCSCRMYPTVGRQAPYTTRHRKAARCRG